MHYTEMTDDWKIYYKKIGKFLFNANNILEKSNISDSRVLRKFVAFYNNEFKYSDCAAMGGEQLCIKPNGDIIVCHAYWNSDKEICGNINKNEFDEILNTNIYKDWQQNLTINKEKFSTLIKNENVEFKGSVGNKGFVTGNKVTDNRFKMDGIEGSAFNRVSLNDELVFSNFRNNQNETLKVVEYYPSVPETFSSSDLYEMIESGQFYLKGYTTITTADGVTSIRSGEVSVTSNTNMAIESDTHELAKAEAEYNSKTAKINNKEKLLDNDLKALDTEHSALNTEMDSVKSLIKDNVDKTFNLFS